MKRLELFKCVYCLKEKPSIEFNVEHVIPRAFGTYHNNMTLHDNQVCKNCNDVFSKELEIKIANDSFEALLRITNGIKDTPGYQLRDTRIKIQGMVGPVKGLDFRLIVDNTNEEKIQLIPYPKIGIKISENPPEYKYYEPDDFPVFSEVIAHQISEKTTPIIYWSMSTPDALMLLKDKGYLIRSHNIVGFKDLQDGETFDTKITFHMDKILNRLVAKIAFNYLIYNEGRSIAFLEKFNPIRNFIRFGTDHESIRIKHSQEKVKNFGDKNGSHVIGLAWGDEYQKSIYGIVSWFSESTHIICLTEDVENIARPLPMSVFNNETRNIETLRQNYVL